VDGKAVGRKRSGQELGVDTNLEWGGENIPMGQAHRLAWYFVFRSSFYPTGVTELVKEKSISQGPRFTACVRLVQAYTLISTPLWSIAWFARS
jgi:hypothetical protein